MELDKLFDLPAHPLLVHIPVVLVPLALIVTLVAFVPRTRRFAAPAAAALALAGGIGVVLATGSGEALEERVDESQRVEEHAEQGQAAEGPAIAFGVVAAAAAATTEVVRRRSGSADARRARSGGRLAAGALAVAAVAGGVATTAVVQAGHSGADAVWHDPNTAGTEGQEGGGEALRP
jgi:uncharacterized membrane protein